MNQADIVEHTQMLGYRRLFEAQPHYDVSNRLFSLREEVKDLAASRLGYRIESVGIGGCSGHAFKIHADIGICQDISAGNGL